VKEIQSALLRYPFIHTYFKLLFSFRGEDHKDLLSS